MRTSDEQQMIRDASARFVRETTARGFPAGRDMDEAVWAGAVESGWAAMCVAEVDGGLGLGAPELCIVAEELGRGLLAGSYLWTTVLPGELIAAAPASALRNALLEALGAGSRALALADAEPGWRGPADEVAVQAEATDQGWVLDGVKTNVVLLDDTQRLLVTAQCAGQLGVYLAPTDAPGLALRRFATLDEGRAAEARLDQVALPAEACLAAPAPANAAARLRACDLGLLGVAAECSGIMQALIAMTAEYLRNRKQFGQAPARFQALRHRMADMALARMRAEALTAQVAVQFALHAPEARTRAVAAACVKALSGAKYVAEQAVQLHGGMGVSEEVPVGRYLRRVLALEAMCGSPEYHLARFQRPEAR